MGYIKQITIQGFKSYKEQTQIEPFSPKSNVIVGRNGSGKSNFFAAVRFVLGDAYHHMDREERQALLHEGSGSAVMSAYVEVCFDNSDERFPNGKSEFYLRRTIGQKKDEYSMDRKNATKADVQALLASAGFSRSNPYYIVPQGRVTALTNMKDAERLTLLKEISGSNLYEDKRKESLRLIAETDSKRSKIDEVVTDIETRLKELETERKELEDYNKKDRERRCLLYVINHQEELGYQQQIDEIDARRQNGIADTDEYSEQFVQNERDMTRIDQEISQLKGQIDLLKDERAQLDGERRDLARNKARVELEYKEMTDGQSAAQKTKKRHDAELKNVQQGIKQREDELAQLLPKYNAKKDEETAVRAQLADAEGQRKRLEDKQGRQAYYSNKRQRDDALRQEINQVNMDLASRKAVLIDTNEQVTALESEIETLEGEIAELHAKIDSRNDDSKGFEKRVENARDTRDRLHDQGKELWREAAKLDSQLRNAEQQLYAAERALSHLTNMETGKGLDTLRRLQKQHKLDGVYGTVGELIKVNPNYKIAAEACAGPSLFHVVVDSDTTSSKIVDMLNKERGGRITFIPLNRMTIKNTQLPKATDAQSLIAKIQYDPTHEKAMQSIFGNAIVCPDLTIAAGYARTHGVKALTPDGDQAHRKGHLFGGWIDPSKSSLDAIQNVAQIREEVEEQRIRRSQIKKEQEKLEQQVTASISELRKIEQQKDQAEHSYGPMRQELKDRQNELQNKQDALIEKRMTAANVESALNLLGDRQGDLDAELNSDFKKKLSSDEEQMLATLAVSVKDLRGQLSKLTSERSELEARKSVVELELRENLQPTLDQLTSQENGATGSTTQSARLKESERLLKKATRALEAVDGKINEAENQIEELNVQLAQSETSRDEKAQANRQLAVAIEKHKKRMNRSMQDRAQAQEDLARVQKEIRELGTLPEEAWTTYGSWSSEKASQRLRKVNEALKKYSHVNKKAFEQYENFTKQRRALTERRVELDSSRESIENLIDILDQRKDEAIDRTFKQVSKAFAEVFVQLVPAGRGRLLIQRKSDREAGRGGFDDESEEDEAAARGQKSTVENYTGVGISVSFNSKHDEQQRIQQLSGGQKSLCALALIFAIQQCDPAPFYLFDEIDANLDAQYRTAVAEMLKKLSGSGGAEGESGGQFICTTFRSEMVLVAEKCYGVTYTNKTSSIDVVDREHALHFVEDMQKR